MLRVESLGLAPWVLVRKSRSKAIMLIKKPLNCEASLLLEISFLLLIGYFVRSLRDTGNFISHENAGVVYIHAAGRIARHQSE